MVTGFKKHYSSDEQNLVLCATLDGSPFMTHLQDTCSNDRLHPRVSLQQAKHITQSLFHKFYLHSGFFLKLSLQKQVEGEENKQSFGQSLLLQLTTTALYYSCPDYEPVNFETLKVQCLADKLENISLLTTPAFILHQHNFTN